MADKVVELRIGLASTPPNSTMPCAHVGGELIAQRAARHADDGELFGQQVGLAEVKERGQQLALGEVARGAKDDENAGVGNALDALGDLGKILGAHSHLHGRHGWFTSNGDQLSGF